MFSYKFGLLNHSLGKSEVIDSPLAILGIVLFGIRLRKLMKSLEKS